MEEEFLDQSVPMDDSGFLAPVHNPWEERPVPPSNFFGISRGVARFGVLFCSGLSFTLLARMIPVLMPGYLLVMVGGTLVAITFATLSRQTPIRIMATIALIIIWLGAIGGSWDAIHATFATMDGQKLFFQVGVVAAVGLLAVGLTQVVGGQRQWNG